MNEKTSAWRTFFWPIQKEEYGKFFFMFAIFFLISFNYNLLRAIKDTLIITAPQSGAEAIPFIKVWGILPMAFFMTFLFTRLSNRMDREKVFNTMLLIFFCFFAFFTFILYPLRESIQPHESIERLSRYFPQGFQGFLALFRNWTFAVFYIMSELWSTMILSVLFWGFANDITSVSEAKRFYALLGVGANVAGIISGQVVAVLSSTIYSPRLPFGNNAWDQSVLYMNLTIMAIIVLIMILFWTLNRRIIRWDSVPWRHQVKPKMSLRETFSYLGKSKYLICIAVIVVTYNIAINLIEIIWKDQIKQLYPNPSDYNAYMGQVMTVMGVIATLTALFISGNMLRKFPWTFSAMIPPIIVLVTGTGFFAFFLLKHSWLTVIAACVGSTPLIMCVFFGSMQNCMSRAAKYTLFDATKEIAFIPLGQECKLKGKAAIDGVGSRIGKSGGSIIYQVLLLQFVTVAASAPYIGLIFLAIVGGWIAAVLTLGKEFSLLVAKKATLEISEEAESKAKTEGLT
ncbi:MAG: Npt1/Npt2 family nucleotide transporter [Chlamydiota bacterium]